MSINEKLRLQQEIEARNAERVQAVVHPVSAVRDYYGLDLSWTDEQLLAFFRQMGKIHAEVYCSNVGWEWTGLHIYINPHRPDCMRYTHKQFLRALRGGKLK